MFTGTQSLAIGFAIAMSLLGGRDCQAQACRRLPPIDGAVPWTVAPTSWLEDSRGETVQDATHNDSGRNEFDGSQSSGSRNRPGSEERLIDRATDPTAWLMAYMIRDEAVVALDASDEDLNELDCRAQIPFMAFDQVHVVRVDIEYDISGPNGDGLDEVLLFDLVVFQESWGRWGIGPSIGLMPASSTGESTFLAGPAAAFSIKNEHWTFAFLMQNYLGGTESQTDLQPIMVYKFNERFAISNGEQKFEYDWYEGNWIQVPLGFQLDYIADVANQKIEFFVNPQYSFRNSSGNAEWQIYFGIVLLVPEA